MLNFLEGRCFGEFEYFLISYMFRLIWLLMKERDFRMMGEPLLLFIVFLEAKWSFWNIDLGTGLSQVV